jgi:hypothetical protein
VRRKEEKGREREREGGRKEGRKEERKESLYIKGNHDECEKPSPGWEKIFATHKTENDMAP